MELFIDTTRGSVIRIELNKNDKIVAFCEFDAKYSQAEKLLPSIDKLIKENNLILDDLKNIKVSNYGGGFTALRIGIVTANALAYSLGIPVYGTHGEKKGDFVVPFYDREPNIT